MNTSAVRPTGAEPHIKSFSTMLWLGALMLAGAAAVNPFPDELDELAMEFFSRFKPLAQA